MEKTPEEVAHLTPHELIEMWKGYLWRRQQKENMIASLITVWIANWAGKSSKKRIDIKDVFKDGRFRKPLTKEDYAIIEELYK